MNKHQMFIEIVFWELFFTRTPSETFTTGAHDTNSQYSWHYIICIFLFYFFIFHLDRCVDVEIRRTGIAFLSFVARMALRYTETIIDV